MRRIALVGTASSGVLAPYDDLRWEIWGVSSRAPYVTRATRWMELHRLDGEPPDWAARWRATVREFTKDIPELVMMYPERDLAPKVTQYPMEHIVNRFGSYFMSSTFSWMMALAIDELRPENGEPVPGEIAIFGVDMEYGTEYRQQRQGFRHFIELAKFAGINVIRLASGGLAYEPVPYPMWQDDPLMTKVEFRKGLNKKSLDIRAESLDATRSMIDETYGVIGAARAIKAGANIDEQIAAAEQRLPDLQKTYNSLTKDIEAIKAVMDEQNWLLDYISP